MQDNNGATASGGADASTTWQMLVDALNVATGANYQWVDQEPIDDAEGGEPGGNIRVGFLYNTDRVQLGDLDANATLAERRQYTDRIGDGVRDAGDLIAFSDDMLGAEINTADWSSDAPLAARRVHLQRQHRLRHRQPLAGQGRLGRILAVQPESRRPASPTIAAGRSATRSRQDVYAMLNLIETSAPSAGIVAGGDFNDFYFYRPLTTVTGYTLADGTARVGGARFDNLTLTLAEAERYTYTFDGRSQAIDHIIVNGLLSGGRHLRRRPPQHRLQRRHRHRRRRSPTTIRASPRSTSATSPRLLIGTAGADTIDGFGGNDIDPRPRRQRHADRRRRDRPARRRRRRRHLSSTATRRSCDRAVRRGHATSSMPA